MPTLITYFSHSGNTKKVAEMILEKARKASIDVVCKDVSNVTDSDIEAADKVIIGTPVHGLILFGQHAAKPARDFVKSLPENLQQKKFILFATYLFFPSNALSGIERTIQEKQGDVQTFVAMHRKKKEELAQVVFELISS
ncbi:MAG: flavodoxin family protein [Candidatus Heimdallarchaeaceae archaeon]